MTQLATLLPRRTGALFGASDRVDLREDLRAGVQTPPRRWMRPDAWKLGGSREG